LAAATCFVAIVASLADADERATLDQIKVHLKAQREKIKSLYIEEVSERKISVEPEVLESLLGDSAPWFASSEENHFAYKEDKRYRRRIRPQEAVLIRPEPSLGKDTGDTVRIRRPDMIHAYDGRTYWSRTSDSGQVAFETGRKTGLSPPLYMKRIGLHIPEPYLKDKGVEFQPISLLPELFEKWTYTVSDDLDKVDGATCVVLEGAFVWRHVGDESMTIADRLWLDVEHGFALRQRERQIGAVSYRVVNSDFREILPGLWFPGKSASLGFRGNDRTSPFSETQLKLTRIVVNEVTDDLFEVKTGDHVVD
jgi:hypothetical protein